MSVVMQRKQLRRDLGIRRLRETTIGTTAMVGSLNGAFIVRDPGHANPDFSGQGMYERAWVRAGSGGAVADYRVGSFNAPSGAWVSGQLVSVLIPSSSDFEVHTKMDPAVMDQYIDETIMQLRVRQEVGISSVDGKSFYDLDTAASPHTIKAVLNAYWFSSPDSSLSRERHDFTQEQIVWTGSGMELRMPGGLGASVQIVLDALLQMTLGASELATVNLGQYDEEVVLWGAAARCYDSLMQDSPGQEFGNYATLNARAVRQAYVLMKKGLPQITAKISFDSAFEHQGRTLGALDG